MCNNHSSSFLALSLGIRMNNTVVEAVGSVDACVEILSGELDAAITVQLFTLDGTAQGKLQIDSSI